MKDLYVRSAAVVRVIDGDTFVADVDLGFFVTVRMSCRVAGINAAEHDQPGGPEARTGLASVLRLGAVSVRSVRSDKYAGRFDADVAVTAPEGQVWDVAGWLVGQGLAVRWDGTGPRPPVAWPPPAA